MESGTVYPYRTLKLTWSSVAALPRDHAAERQSLGRRRRGSEPKGPQLCPYHARPRRGGRVSGILTAARTSWTISGHDGLAWRYHLVP